MCEGCDIVPLSLLVVHEELLNKSFHFKLFQFDNVFRREPLLRQGKY